MGVALRRRLRGLAANLLLAIVSAAVAFGGAEIVLRLGRLAPPRALRSADAVTLSRIPGLFQPGQEFTDLLKPDLPARIRINDLGFRGRDLAEVKPPGAVRILALGDSYTFGAFVDDDQTYPARLEKMLQARRAGRAIEVVNGGVGGFGILDERALWEKAGERLDPAIVLITFSPNDVSDMTRPRPMIEQMRAHADLKSSLLLGPPLRLLMSSAVFNGLQIVAARIRSATRSHAAIPEIEPSRAGPERAPEAWEAYHEALKDLASRIQRGGRRALLVLYPSHGTVQGADRPWGSEILPAWALQADLPCLDLLPAFRAAPLAADLLYLVPKDPHPSPAGHALAASRIAEEIERLGWLSDPGPALRE